MTQASTLIRTKVCRKCGLELAISDFYVCASNKDGYRNYCKHCMIDQNMKRRKDDPDHQVKHHTVLHEAPKKKRVANGKGKCSEYAHRYYQENKAMIKAKNRADYIKRKVAVEVKKRPEEKQVVTLNCKDHCANWPCFTGIENIESNLAVTCHGFKRKEI